MSPLARTKLRDLQARCREACDMGLGHALAEIRNDDLLELVREALDERSTDFGDGMAEVTR